MKKVFSFIFVVSVLLCFLTGCSKNDDLYYVKYELIVTGSSSYAINTQITLNTEKGEQSFKSGTEFSETFGPVEKGFVARIMVSGNRNISANVRIYVCRGDEPFVLKLNNTFTLSSYNKVMTYKIDF